MTVLEEECIGQGHQRPGDHKRGLCAGTGSNDSGVQPVNYRPAGSLGGDVDNRSSEAVPCLYWVDFVTQQ